MKKRIKLHTSSETNPATNLWFRHLLERLIIEQLDLPEKLKAKVLYEASHRGKGR